jgi:Zn-dependent peptidase ImmA (M78 family)
MIYGARVRQARELRDLPQKDLAQLLEVSPGRLAQIELAHEPVQMSDAQVDALTAALRLPPAFFTVPTGQALSEGSMRFRARKTVTKKVLAKARREAELTHEIAQACARVVDAPPARVPSVPARAGVEEAAAQARAALGVPPDEPIPNVTRALERAGVWVFLLDTTVPKKLDAFSTWVGPHLDRPVIAIGDGLVWDRYRHTESHELGHLVMHQAAGDDPTSGEDLEKEADRFASAFLLPREPALEELPRPFVLSKLAPLKMRWGVSFAGLINRAWALDLISAEQRTSLFKQLSARDWRLQEPLHDAREAERPRALRKMIELAYGQPVDIRRLAAEIGRYPVDVAREIDRYAGPPSSSASRSARGAAAPVITLAHRRATRRGLRLVNDGEREA